jgi:hypothetical protein
MDNETKSVDARGRRIPQYLPQLVIVLVGILLFIWAFHIAGNDRAEQHMLWIDLIKDFGVVIAALAVTDFVWKLVGGDPISVEIEQLQQTLSEQVQILKRANELTKQAEDMGLCGVQANRSPDPATWLQLIGNARVSIDLCDLTLKDFAENRDILDALVKAASGGVAIRILMVDPNTNVMDSLAENSIDTENDTKYTLRELSSRLRSDRTRDDRFAVHLLQEKALQVGIRRFDDRIYIQHYLHSRNPSTTPALIVSGKQAPLFKLYVQEFNRLYEKAAKYDWESAVFPLNALVRPSRSTRAPFPSAIEAAIIQQLYASSFYRENVQYEIRVVAVDRKDVVFTTELSYVVRTRCLIPSEYKMAYLCKNEKGSKILKAHFDDRPLRVDAKDYVWGRGILIPQRLDPDSRHKVFFFAEEHFRPEDWELYTSWTPATALRVLVWKNGFANIKFDIELLHSEHKPLLAETEPIVIDFTDGLLPHQGIKLNWTVE